jgi:hypothetical protein
MTVEGTPEFSFNIDESWKKSYAKQRYDRLVDCLADYLDDKLLDQLVNDIQSATIEMETYHIIEANAWRQLRDKLFIKEKKCNPSS